MGRPETKRRARACRAWPECEPRAVLSVLELDLAANIRRRFPDSPSARKLVRGAIRRAGEMRHHFPVRLP